MMGHETMAISVGINLQNVSAASEVKPRTEPDNGVSCLTDGSARA